MFGSELRRCKALADRLHRACPAWDARVTQFGQQLAVVMDVTERARDVHMIVDGRWTSQMIVEDENGDGAPVGPHRDLEIPARQVDQAAARTLQEAIGMYRSGLNMDEDDEFVEMKRAAEQHLPGLLARR